MIRGFLPACSVPVGQLAFEPSFSIPASLAGGDQVGGREARKIIEAFGERATSNLH